MLPFSNARQSRKPSVRFALALLLLLASFSPAFADGRADWSEYYWRVKPFGQCLDAPGNGCLTHHAKWDWKRDQWVTVRYASTGSGLDLAITLTNNDPHDDDYVCVTILFADVANANVAAYHANLHSDPRSTLEHRARVTVPEAALARIAKVDIGTKQCRQGARQDDAVYDAVLSALSR